MERRTFLKNTGLFGLASLVTPAGILRARDIADPEDHLLTNFRNPPGSAKPHTWWHWMNGNVSREGITLDLEAMARVGIGGFQNFDAGTGIPEGPIEYLSPDWLALKRHAIAEAERLGLEFTIHNCPGWSSSGGPWITPELAMQEVTWSELVVAGGRNVDVVLPKPFHRLDTLREIAVLAYRSFPGENPLSGSLKSIRTHDKTLGSENVTGQDKAVRIIPPKEGTGFLELQWNELQEIEQVSFIITSFGDSRSPIGLLASEGGRDFIQFASINTGSNFGQPQGSVHVIENVRKTRLKFLRLTCDHELDISQLRFSSVARPEDWRKRANFEFNRHGVADLPDAFPAIAESDIIEVTEFMKPDGSFSWRVPEGNWTILRLAFTPTGTLNRSAPDTGVGLECDKFSASAFEFHFHKMMQSLLEFLGPMRRAGRVGMLIDSYEVGMQNWTSGFEGVFEKRSGYNILKYLPALTGRVVGDASTTDRFLWDFRRTQGDLMADNYYGKFAELCREHNIIAYIQPYDRGPMEEMQIGSRIDINVGEFWNSLSSIFQNNWTMRRTVKLSAAIAHTNAQRIVAAESFTGEPESSRWQQHPFSLKMVGDRMFTQGLNRMVFHRFAHQPHPTAKPGMTMGPWGSHFDRTNTWWEQGKAWIAYLSRCQYMLQQGLFVADLAYFSGEEAGVYTKVERHELDPPPPAGYGYDLINGESLIRNAKVVSNRLVLPDGMSYEILILQRPKAMSVELLEKIKEFVSAGLLVVGEKPERTPGLAGSAGMRFNDLVRELWEDGRITSGKSIGQVVASRGLRKDFAYSSSSGSAAVAYIHRRTADCDIYFLANHKRTFEHVVCTFRVTNRQPEIWNPVDGTHTTTPVFKTEEGQTTVGLDLDEAGSLFVIFRNPPAAIAVASIKLDDTLLASAQHIKVQTTNFSEVINNFTYAVWLKPENNAMLDINNFMDGHLPWTDYYAIYPPPGGKKFGPGHATSGLAAGRNGIAVWENSTGKPEFVVSARTPISGWAHVAVVYRKGVPHLFVNGKALAKGPQSRYTIHPAGHLASLQEGASFFNGDMLKPIFLNEDLTDEQISELAAVAPDVVPSRQSMILKGDQCIMFEGGKLSVDRANRKSFTAKVPRTEPLDISADWTVSFPDLSGAPDSITLTRLSSLHLHEVPGVRYFSGTATYKKRFTFSDRLNRKERKYFLNLGTVEVIAEVILNDRRIGTFWKRPFMIDITDSLEKENHLVVGVTNLWPNRLIGDEQIADPNEYSPGAGGSGFASLSGGAIQKLPEWYQKGLPKPEDGRIAFSTWKHYTSDSPLLQSGLVGPVAILTGFVYDL